MSSEGLQVYRSAHQAFNRRDFEALSRVFTSDHVFIDHGRQILAEGPDAFIQIARDEIAQASDAAVTDPEYFDAGDAVVCRFLATGTNNGPIGGALPATGRTYAIPILEIVHLTAAGVARTELFQDIHTFLVQLGLRDPVPTPPLLAPFRDAYLDAIPPSAI